MMKIQKKHYPVLSYAALILLGGFGIYATCHNFAHRKDGIKVDKFERGKK